MGVIFGLIRHIIVLIVSFVVNVFARSVIIGFRLALSVFLNSAWLKIAVLLFLGIGLMYIVLVLGGMV